MVSKLNRPVTVSFQNELSLCIKFEIMTAIELKTILIHRISEINDISFLQAIKTILDSKTEAGVLKLSSEQLDEIIASKKEIEKSLFIDNDELDKDFTKWVNSK